MFPLHRQGVREYKGDCQCEDFSVYYVHYVLFSIGRMVGKKLKVLVLCYCHKPLDITVCDIQIRCQERMRNTYIC